MERVGDMLQLDRVSSHEELGAGEQKVRPGLLMYKIELICVFEQCAGLLVDLRNHPVELRNDKLRELGRRDCGR